MLVQVLSPEEVEPSYTGRVHLVDSESLALEDEKNFKVRITGGLQHAYKEALLEMQNEIKTYCRSRGAEFITISTDMPIEKALFGKLLNAGVIA